MFKTSPYSLIIIFLLATQTFASSTSSRPNVILVMTDDQGYGDVGCHGNAILQTPHLDALHADAVRFTDFHVSFSMKIVDFCLKIN